MLYYLLYIYILHIYIYIERANDVSRVLLHAFTKEHRQALLEKLQQLPAASAKTWTKTSEAYGEPFKAGGAMARRRVMWICQAIMVPSMTHRFLIMKWSCLVGKASSYWELIILTHSHGGFRDGRMMELKAGMENIHGSLGWWNLMGCLGCWTLIYCKLGGVWCVFLMFGMMLYRWSLVVEYVLN